MSPAKCKSTNKVPTCYAGSTWTFKFFGSVRRIEVYWWAVLKSATRAFIALQHHLEPFIALWRFGTLIQAGLHSGTPTQWHRFKKKFAEHSQLTVTDLWHPEPGKLLTGTVHCWTFWTPVSEIVPVRLDGTMYCTTNTIFSSHNFSRFYMGLDPSTYQDLELWWLSDLSWIFRAWSQSDPTQP